MDDQAPPTDAPDAATEDDLYGMPPGDFVRARDQLVRTLRRAGDRDGATRVAALRRPSPGAWALNQVARRDPEAVDDLLTTATAMRDATQAALGGDARPLREIAPRERQVVQRLVEAALVHLRGTGKEPSDVVRQRLATTVRAAMADEHFGELLRSGTLTDDLQPSGFGIEGLTFSETAAPPRRPVRSDVRPPARHTTDPAPTVEPAVDEPADHHRPDEAEARRAREAQAKQALLDEADERARVATQLAADAAAREEEAQAAEAAAQAAEAAAQSAQATARARRREADTAAAAAASARAEARRARDAAGR